MNELIILLLLLVVGVALITIDPRISPVCHRTSKFKWALKYIGLIITLIIIAYFIYISLKIK